MIVGLTGSHRVGKSTLARMYAEKHKLDFLETSASAIFREMGFDPAITYDFDTRLTIQEEILRQFDKQYASHSGSNAAITDRTPLDMLAYTLGDVSGETLNEANEVRLCNYVQDCFTSLNKWFSVLLVVQPGIALIPADGKASLSVGYIEHLNSIILGLCVDEKSCVPHYYIPRHMRDNGERLAALEYSVNRVRVKAMGDRDRCGATLH